MADRINDVGDEPQDTADMRWKREVMRVLSELIEHQQADRSEIDYLKGLR